MNRLAAEVRAIVPKLRTPLPLADLIPLLQRTADSLEHLTSMVLAIARSCENCMGSRKVPEVWDLYHMTDHTFGAVTWRQRLLRRRSPRVHQNRSAVVVGLKPCPACADLWQVLETSGGLI